VAKFPEPPAPRDLAIPSGAELRPLPAGTSLWRVYFRGGPHGSAWDRFRHFGPTTARFDHHEPPPHMQSRGILYAATHGPTCLAEVYQNTRVIDLRRRAPWLVELELTRDVVLLDLTSRWVTRAGASAAIASGSRPRARRWSQVIYEALPTLDGLFYASSMDPQGTAVALWERARNAVPAHPRTHRALADPTLLSAMRAAARAFGYDLI
jgi:hypothetical protein